jgi:hypothetical protein
MYLFICVNWMLHFDAFLFSEFVTELEILHEVLNMIRLQTL